MAQFKAHELDVLVATTVIEVGVDVANSTVMIVQEADRFGLAQLHQLRGRVGRGGEQSYCLLVSRAKDELTDSARARLEAMVETTDGFELAERDLEIRGEGELLGTRQSGAFGLRFASLRGDRDLLELARREAEALAGGEGLLQAKVLLELRPQRRKTCKPASIRAIIPTSGLIEEGRSEGHLRNRSGGGYGERGGHTRGRLR